MKPAVFCIHFIIRLQVPLFEFNYMIMQSYDFLYLNEHYGCNMQFGGDDQWSNMLAGTDLIRRKTGKDAYAMTIRMDLL